MIRPLFAFIFLLVLTSGNGVAQNYDTFWNYDISDGIPTNSLYNLFIDSKGNIWFGSDFGVTCYNGQTFKNYSTDDGLEDNTVLRVFEDKSGRIWFHHNNRLPSYLENGEFKRLAFKKRKIIVTSSSEFVQLANGKIYLGCSGGFLEIDPDVHLNFLEEDPRFNLSILGVKNNQIYLMDNSISTKQITTINLVPAVKILALKSPNISITLSRSSQFAFSIYNGKQNKFLFPNIFNEITSKSNYCIVNRGDRTYCSTANGIYVFVRSNGKYFLAEHLLKNKKIVSMVFDKVGNLWASSLGNGLYFFPNSGVKNLFENQIEKVFSQCKFGNRVVYGFESGKILVSDGKTLKPFLTQLQKEIKNLAVRNIYYDESNNYSLELGRYVLYKFNSSIGKRIDHHLVPSLGTTYSKNQNKVFFNTHKGFLTLDLATDNYTLNSPEVIGKSKKIVEYQGELYIATQKGVYKIKNGIPRMVFAKTIQDNRVNDLLIYKNEMIISTGNTGIWLYNGKRLKNYTLEEGLLSNQTFLLRSSPRGTIWISTNLGLQEIEIKNGLLKEVKRFDLKTNLLTAEIVDMDDIGNYLMITTENNLFSYENNTRQNNLKLNLFVTEFRLNSKKIKDAILNAQSEDNLKITTSVPNFTKHPTEYFYRINKETWVKNNSEIFSFLKLSPGDYELEIYAKSPFFQDSDVQTIRFSVSEKWYQNNFILVNIFSLVILILILFFRRRALKKAEHKRAVLKSELLSLQSQMNPHFTFNSLNSIQSYLGAHDQRSAQIYLADFANLMRTILDQAKLHLISLDKEVEFLKNYLDLEKRRLENQFDYEIIIDETIEKQNTLVPTLMLQPFVENAIWHGVAGLDYQGLITIHFKKVASKIVCEIIDNGQGFEKSQKANTSRPYHKSTGIVNCRERIELFKEIYHHKITLNFLSPDTKTTGTIVQVSFPHLNLNESRI